MRKLHVTARLTIAELAKEGVTLDPVADFHHLVELDRLAREAAGLSNRWKTQRAFFPTVGTGNVTLRRLSIGARIFFCEEVAPNLPADNPVAETACLAFVMAHGHEPETGLWPFAGRPAAFSKAVNAWLKTVGTSWDELSAAVASLLAQEADPAGAAAEDECDYGEICATLAREFGRDPAWWFWQAPESLAAEMLEKIQIRRDAEERASARAAGKAYAPDPAARWVRAKVALDAYKASIILEKRPAVAS